MQRAEPFDEFPEDFPGEFQLISSALGAFQKFCVFGWYDPV
jgi:hypothetical protein